MTSKEKDIADFVDISSSDDEDIAGVRTKKRSLYEIISQSATRVLGRQASQSSQEQALESANVTSSVADYSNLHSRSFWKAGSEDVLPTSMSQVAQAIAELLDNAIDESTLESELQNKNMDFVQHTSGPGAEYEVVDVDNLDDPGPLSSAETREENILLFMRRKPGLKLEKRNKETWRFEKTEVEEEITMFYRFEEHLQNQIKFKQKIQDLEKELKEAKMKRDQLLSYVESRKRPKA